VTVAGSSANAVPVRPGEHACCTFPRAEDRERLTVAFIRDRLRRGEKVVYFFDGDDAAAVVSRFERRDARMRLALKNGQLEVRRSRDAYLPDDHFEGNRMVALVRRECTRARDEGYRAMSVVGEIPGAICELPGCEQLGMYEAQLDTDYDTTSCSLLCQYDHRRLDPDVLSDVIDVHGVQASPDLAAIGRDGELAAVRDRRGALRLAGELDFGCAQTVSEALEAHIDSPLRLDLADLSFVDVAGMRALRAPQGRPLRIDSASAPVRRLLELLGWDTDPRVQVAA
jgi:anti-anti-sigma regulatory factor